MKNNCHGYEHGLRVRLSRMASVTCYAIPATGLILAEVMIFIYTNEDNNGI